MFIRDENFYQFDWKKAYDSVLAQLEVLRAENDELKKKLKTAPPKGTIVRDKETGMMGYSLGRFDSDGWLLIQNKNDDFNCPDGKIEDWEKIEVKVK